MIKCTADPMGQLDISNYSGIKNIPDETQIWLSIYFHDEIEDMLLYDIPTWLEGDLLTDFTDGIHKVNVLLPDHTELECDMYIWRDCDASPTIWCVDDKRSYPLLRYKGYIIIPNSNSEDIVQSAFHRRTLSLYTNIDRL